MQRSYKHILALASVFLGACVYFSLSFTTYTHLTAQTSVAPLLTRTSVSPGKAVKPGTKLRILCVGDSITAGLLSGENGSNGNGYRLQLRDDLSEDEVVFAGTVASGNMTDGYYAAWNGRRIGAITDMVGPALTHRPNIVLIHAGTNDMSVKIPGDHSADGAAERLGHLIDKVMAACPDAVILVAVLIPRCGDYTAASFPAFQSLIPKVVEQRRSGGGHVLAVDMSTFPESELHDCLHPTSEGYRELGHSWYDFVTQIPTSWINDPVGPDPERNETNTPGNGNNGGKAPAARGGTLL
ncbi:SGNH hydrolase-type esterase domain-containing protein [Dactylonectria estremocensis]|uniref:SGNH hydrolase-type esterase domain-containing protein n=1 Tax=Dactylonectria estremocensis TaxID=1079267 RepID=A0A9P9E830_9HYPO|nr:SGNH hydrolase-type esterase domain-containing protein [Dactylonectria estremocensis]